MPTAEYGPLDPAIIRPDSAPKIKQGDVVWIDGQAAADTFAANSSRLKDAGISPEIEEYLITNGHQFANAGYRQSYIVAGGAHTAFDAAKTLKTGAVVVRYEQSKRGLSPSLIIFTIPSFAQPRWK